jgi:MFS family permease
MDGWIWALVAGLLCMATHWAADVLSQGRLHRVARYVLGVAAIGGAFLGWCRSAGSVAAMEAWGVWLGIALAAGAGTALAYLVDWAASSRRLVRLLEGQVGDEPGSARDSVRGE